MLETDKSPIICLGSHYICYGRLSRYLRPSRSRVFVSILTRNLPSCILLLFSLLSKIQKPMSFQLFKIANMCTQTAHCCSVVEHGMPGARGLLPNGYLSESLDFYFVFLSTFKRRKHNSRICMLYRRLPCHLLSIWI